MIYKNDKERMESWKVVSPTEKGFYEVISPSFSDCKELHIFRLNLPTGGFYTIETGLLEMNGVVIDGSCAICGSGLNDTLKKFDAFFLSAGQSLTVQATEPLILYIGAARGNADGFASVRHFDKTLPIADIHQIHGHGVGEREVMFTCEPALPARSLICGLTWSREGTWTSWPPHQHEKDLEEAYCYFDMDPPKMGLHLSYLKSENREELVAHTVQSGTMVLAPRGYHPTVSMPGGVNAYFWVMAALRPASRRYDLAITDPTLINT